MSVFNILVRKHVTEARWVLGLSAILLFALGWLIAFNTGRFLNDPVRQDQFRAVAEARAPFAKRESVAYALGIIEQRARIARDLARRAIGAAPAILAIDELLETTIGDALDALAVEAARSGVRLTRVRLRPPGSPEDPQSKREQPADAFDQKQRPLEQQLEQPSNGFGH